MKRIIPLLLCMLLLASCATESEKSAKAPLLSSLDLTQEDRQPIPVQDYYKPAIKEILEKDALVVGMMREDMAPFIYQTDDGSMDGLDVEIALGIANSLGVELRIESTAASFDELYTNLAMRRYDMVLSKFSLTSERAMAIHYSTPYVTLKQAFLVNKKMASQYGATEYPFDHMHKPGALLGAVSGTWHESYLAKNFSEAVIHTYQDAASMIDAVIAGDIFAGVYDDITFVQELMTNHEVSLHATIYTVEDLRDYICAAVPQDSDGLLDVIDAYLMANCYSYTLDDLIRDFPESFD